MIPLSSAILFEPSGSSAARRVSLFRLEIEAGDVVDVEEVERRVEAALAEHEALQREVEAAR